jgi:hypothetical protein
MIADTDGFDHSTTAIADLPDLADDDHQDGLVLSVTAYHRRWSGTAPPLTCGNTTSPSRRLRSPTIGSVRLSLAARP